MKLWRGAGLALLVWAHVADPVLAAPPGEAWLLRSDDPSTKTAVYTRDRGAAPAEFHAQTQIRSRLSALVAVLLDTERMPQWVYRTRMARNLVSRGPTAGVAFVVTAMPWPLADRESVVDWTLVQDTASGEVLMQGRPATVGPEPHPDRVRMHDFASSWRFRPLSGGEVEVHFEGYGNLGGRLDLPLLRDFAQAAVWTGPLQTLWGLRRMAQSDDYQARQLDFILEPPP